MIALELASHAPQRVRSLSLLVTTRGKTTTKHGHGDIFRTLFSRNSTVLTNSLLRLLYPKEFLAKHMEDQDATTYDILFASHLEMLRQHHMLPRRIGIAGQIRAIGTHYVSNKRLAAIAAHGFPILILTGRQDHLIPAKESERLSRLLPGPHVRTVIFEDAGHGVFIQYLDEVVAELMQTFQQASASTI